MQLGHIPGRAAINAPQAHDRLPAAGRSGRSPGWAGRTPSTALLFDEACYAKVTSPARVIGTAVTMAHASCPAPTAANNPRHSRRQMGHCAMPALRGAVGGRAGRRPGPGGIGVWGNLGLGPVVG